MSFNPNDPKLTAYIFGELGDQERAAFEAEIESSKDLQLAVQQTRKTLDALRVELSEEPELRLSQSQRAAVDREIAHAAAPQPRTADSNRRMMVTLAAAATLLVACGLGYTFFAGSDGPRSVAYTTTSSSPAEASSDEGGGSKADYSSLVEMEMMDETVLDDLNLRVTDNSAERSQKVADRELAERPSDLRKSLAGASSLSSSSEAKPLPPAGAAPAPVAEPTSSSPVVAEQLKSRLAADEKKMRLAAPAPGKPLAQSPQLVLGRSNRGAAPAGTDGLALGERVRSETAREQSLVEQQLNKKARPDDGEGPGRGGDKFDRIHENPFKLVGNEPLSTFSIDVDTASYSKSRMYLLQQGVLPRPDSIRIEELVNYFTYNYEPPSGDDPFAARMEVADCPWKPGHRLLRVGLKGKEIANDQRPTSNLVFLLDVSGSMKRPNKLPLLKRGMKMLVDQLGENDRAAIVVYAGAAGLVLDSTTGDNKGEIMAALDRLHAGGSTNGGQGIRLAYQTALDNFITGGVNRVILCTDGDFNVGTTGTDELVRLAEENAKTGVFLSVLGFGMGNHNDAMLEQISNKGNGNYAFVDSDTEAKKVLVEQMSGTLVTIAKDVKIQIEFNPNQVAAYRLIGYENRILAAEDFNDDKKDAGEIGAGHTVTALYEIVPAGADTDVKPSTVDDLKYQQKTKPSDAADSGELLTLKLRYKQPDGDTSKLLEFPLTDAGKKFGQTDKDFRFAAAVASFGMLLRGSEHSGDATYDAVLEIAADGAQDDASGYRAELLDMVRKAKELSGQ